MNVYAPVTLGRFAECMPAVLEFPKRWLKRRTFVILDVCIVCVNLTKGSLCQKLMMTGSSNLVMNILILWMMKLVLTPQSREKENPTLPETEASLFEKEN